MKHQSEYWFFSVACGVCHRNGCMLGIVGICIWSHDCTGVYCGWGRYHLISMGVAHIIISMNIHYHQQWWVWHHLFSLWPLAAPKEVWFPGTWEGGVVPLHGSYSPSVMVHLATPTWPLHPKGAWFLCMGPAPTLGVWSLPPPSHPLPLWPLYPVCGNSTRFQRLPAQWCVCSNQKLMKLISAPRFMRGAWCQPIQTIPSPNALSPDQWLVALDTMWCVPDHAGFASSAIQWQLHGDGSHIGGQTFWCTTLYNYLLFNNNSSHSKCWPLEIAQALQA